MNKPLIDFDHNAPIPASDYDQAAQLALPGYEAMHTMVLACLQAYLPKDADLLIVGAGTSKELIRFGQAQPQWHLHGVDPSAKMLAIAQQKVAQHHLSQRVTLTQGYTQDLPGDVHYHAATSILVMHFIPTADKLQFLDNIAQRLSPSAPFILVDVFGQKESQELEQLLPVLQSYWHLMGLPLDKQQQLLTGFDQGVYPLTEASLLQLLNQAGFQQTIRFYTGLWVGGWLAFKS